MMQFYLEYGTRVMKAEEIYQRGRLPAELVLEYLENFVHNFNIVIV